MSLTYAKLLRIARFWALVLASLLLLIVGCSQRDIPAYDSTSQVEIEPQEETTPPSVEPEETSAFSELENPVNPSFSTQSEPAVSTLTPESASGNAFQTTLQPSISCGVLLPIIDESDAVPSSSLDPSRTAQSSVPNEALPALQRILADPGSVGIVAYEIGKEDEGIFFNGDVPMPLASVAKIINLVAYANAVQSGSIDPAFWVPTAEIETAYLPGSDLGAHRAALAGLRERGLISQDTSSVPMEEIPWMMMRYSSNAASDYLQTLIGQDVIEQTILDLEMNSHTAPCPFLGQFLAISNHTRAGSDQLAVEDYVTQPQLYGAEVMALTETFMNDPEFRKAEGTWRAPIATQRFFAEQLNAKGSARDYAKLLEKIARNDLGSDFVNILVRRAFEWPMVFTANQNLFSSVGYKSGSLPGVLNSAYYGTRLEDGAEVVVIVFFHDLPMQTYRRWRQTLPHDEFARWLLSDPQAIETFKSWINSQP